MSTNKINYAYLNNNYLNYNDLLNEDGNLLGLWEQGAEQLTISLMQNKQYQDQNCKANIKGEVKLIDGANNKFIKCFDNPNIGQTSLASCYMGTLSSPTPCCSGGTPGITYEVAYDGSTFTCTDMPQPPQGKKCGAIEDIKQTGCTIPTDIKKPGEHTCIPIGQNNRCLVPECLDGNNNLMTIDNLRALQAVSHNSSTAFHYNSSTSVNILSGENPNNFIVMQQPQSYLLLLSTKIGNKKYYLNMVASPPISRTGYETQSFFQLGLTDENEVLRLYYKLTTDYTYDGKHPVPAAGFSAGTFMAVPPIVMSGVPINRPVMGEITAKIKKPTDTNIALGNNVKLSNGTGIYDYNYQINNYYFNTPYGFVIPIVQNNNTVILANSNTSIDIVDPSPYLRNDGTYTTRCVVGKKVPSTPLPFYYYSSNVSSEYGNYIINFDKTVPASSSAVEAIDNALNFNVEIFIDSNSTKAADWASGDGSVTFNQFFERQFVAFIQKQSQI